MAADGTAAAGGKEPVVHPPPPPPLLLFIANVKMARTIALEISVNDDITMMKSYAARQLGIPVGDMQLIFQGMELKNEYKVKDCKIPQEGVVYLLDLKDTPLEKGGDAKTERKSVAG